MGLTETYKAARMIETVENLGFIDDFSFRNKRTNNALNNHFIDSDEMFWSMILKNPDKFWGDRFQLYHATISDWLPRIPGLFWSKGSELYRASAKNEIALQGKKWIEYFPPGKSAKILGGVGTFILPPASNGYIMKTATFSCNSSVGIPILISPEVINKHILSQGFTISVENITWCKLSGEWTQRFSSVAGIPKGCLLLEDPNILNVELTNSFVQFHPFTLMEYQHNGALLYDYVYLTIDNMEDAYRQKMFDFFDYYKSKDNREGKYLIDVDMNNPLFDGALYDNSEDLRRKDEYGNTQISLINKRIRGTIIKGNNIEQIIAFISNHYYTIDELHVLSRHLRINPGFFTSATPAKIIVQLIDYLIEKNRIEELIDLIAIEHPEFIKN